jgi:hypothetical protein
MRTQRFAYRIRQAPPKQAQGNQIFRQLPGMCEVLPTIASDSSMAPIFSFILPERNAKYEKTIQDFLRGARAVEENLFEIADN